MYEKADRPDCLPRSRLIASDRQARPSQFTHINITTILKGSKVYANSNLAKLIQTGPIESVLWY